MSALKPPFFGIGEDDKASSSSTGTEETQQAGEENILQKTLVYYEGLSSQDSLEVLFMAIGLMV